MSKSIFVSHVFEDHRYVEKMKSWEANGYLTGYTFVFDIRDKRNLGNERIAEYLENKIRGVAVVLVLLGQDTHNHDWIRLEVEFAKKYNKKVCCLEVPGSTGGLPPILRGYRVLPYHPNSLKNELLA